MNSMRQVVQRALPPHACSMSTPASCSMASTSRFPEATSTGAKPSTLSVGTKRYVNVSLTMADVPDIPRPSQLWKHLSSDRKQQAAEAFWRDENAANEQAEAIGMIAQRIKFRLKSVFKMPIEKKAHYLIASPAVSELLAARLLIA